MSSYIRTMFSLIFRRFSVIINNKVLAGKLRYYNSKLKVKYPQYETFLNHINDEGILQLLYIYGFSGNNQFVGFSTYELELI